MKVIADLHVHSKYARGTSPEFDLDGLSRGCQVKGINIMATGDFTHPSYFKHLSKKLAEVEGSESGLYLYNNVRFLLSVEISLIYSHPTGVKKMHHIVLAPSLEIASQINDCLSAYGNIASDGRPIIGMASPMFAELMMGISKDIMIIPAHVWTPWFGAFGSKGGVDTIQEAFEDQAKHIHAIETGLSSDPLMNWMLSGLDKYTLVSNSDAHSEDKLGREANVFNLETLSYKSLTNAIKTKKGFIKTYEFYPEEGKYHFDGHRACEILFSPAQSKKHKGICPVCKKPLTIGVLNRVEELADREYGYRPKQAVPFQYIVPLKTVIAKTIKKGENTLAVTREYDRLIRYFGCEFNIFESNAEQIHLGASPEIAKSILKVKNGEISWVPGYDGEFGELLLDSTSPRARIASDKKQKTLEEF